MESGARWPQLAVVEADNQLFLRDVLHGLSQPQKSIPNKYLYDEAGSRMFLEIRELPDYYPARADASLFARHAEHVAGQLGPSVGLVELGSGSSPVARRMLEALVAPSCYVPVDISGEILDRTVDSMRREYPMIPISPVCADYTSLEPAVVHELFERHDCQSPVVFFPGTTLGNMHLDEMTALLRRVRDLMGERGRFVVGIDLFKNEELHRRAYWARDEVNGEFNRNVLRRVNRELKGTMCEDAFVYDAPFNAAASRIEMHMIASVDQSFSVAGRPFSMRAGESIHTNTSYKHRRDDFLAILASCGFTLTGEWQDDEHLLSLFCFRTPEYLAALNGL